ncbi:MAG: hypothetical protein OHK0053_37330 [Microscillaceae bacterium]
MTRYGRIRYDLFFKRVFSNPPIVMAFLNTVQEKDLKSPITQVSLEPGDFFIKGRNMMLNESKHDVIDVFCIDQEGRRILIEIQKGTNLKAIPRFLDYQCRNFSSQFEPGDNYAEVMACYSVCWFFDLKPPHTSLTETITLCSSESDTNWQFEWKIKALYPVNLDYESLKQRMIEKIEEWMLLDVVQDPEIAQQIKEQLRTPPVNEAFSELDTSGYSEEQLRLVEYEEFVLEYQDLILRDTQKKIEEARERERKEREEALERERKEKEETILAVAKNLLNQGLSPEAIAQATGLPIPILKNLQP